MIDKSIKSFRFSTYRGNPGVGVRWQVSIGWPSCGLWIDNRGIVLDLGKTRREWWITRSERDLLFHARQLPVHWYGRTHQCLNPNRKVYL